MFPSDYDGNLEKAIARGDTNKIAAALAAYGDENKAETKYNEICMDMWESGDLTDEAAVDALSEVMSEEKAQKKIDDATTKRDFSAKYADVEGADDMSANRMRKYDEYCSDVIDIDEYVSFWDEYSDLPDNKKATVLPFVDEYFSTTTQKDAMYRALGYADSAIGDAPWH